MSIKQILLTHHRHRNRVVVSLSKNKFRSKTCSALSKQKNSAINATATHDIYLHKQCDQMAILFVQCLAIHSNENLPKSINDLQK